MKVEDELESFATEKRRSTGPILGISRKRVLGIDY